MPMKEGLCSEENKLRYDLWTKRGGQHFINITSHYFCLHVLDTKRNFYGGNAKTKQIWKNVLIWRFSNKFSYSSIVNFHLRRPFMKSE